VLGENFLRVFAEAERVSRSLSKTISGDGSLKRIPEKEKASSDQIKTEGEYRARSKDLIEFHLEGVVDQCCLEVDERGLIQLPFMEGNVYAAGKTATELSSELVTHFKKHLKRPRVQIRVYPTDLKK
jgi:protein involved in polysaccharide export with SLBB domain